MSRLPDIAFTRREAKFTAPAPPKPPRKRLERTLEAMQRILARFNEIQRRSDVKNNSLHYSAEEKKSIKELYRQVKAGEITMRYGVKTHRKTFPFRSLYSVLVQFYRFKAKDSVRSKVKK